LYAGARLHLAPIVLREMCEAGYNPASARQASITLSQDYFTVNNIVNIRRHIIIIADIKAIKYL
jgi:hypothetical protein